MTLKNICLMIVVLYLSFVENAPSNDKKSFTEDELHLRLVFIDRDADNALSSSHIKAKSTIYPAREQESELARSRNFIKLSFASNNPTEDAKIGRQIKPSNGLSRMDDERQNWGLVVEDKEFTEDESYYNRPVTLPKEIMQAKTQKTPRVNTKQVAVKTEKTVEKPTVCHMAVVTCCSNSEGLKECFKAAGCNNVTDAMFADLCNPMYIRTILDIIGNYYKNSGAN